MKEKQHILKIIFAFIMIVCNADIGQCQAQDEEKQELFKDKYYKSYAFYIYLLLAFIFLIMIIVGQIKDNEQNKNLQIQKQYKIQKQREKENNQPNSSTNNKNMLTETSHSIKNQKQIQQQSAQNRLNTDQSAIPTQFFDTEEPFDNKDPKIDINALGDEENINQKGNNNNSQKLNKDLVRLLDQQDYEKEEKDKQQKQKKNQVALTQSLQHILNQNYGVHKLTIDDKIMEEEEEEDQNTVTRKSNNQTIKEVAEEEDEDISPTKPKKKKDQPQSQQQESQRNPLLPSQQAQKQKNIDLIKFDSNNNSPSNKKSFEKKDNILKENPKQNKKQQQQKDQKQQQIKIDEKQKKEPKPISQAQQINRQKQNQLVKKQNLLNQNYDVFQFVPPKSNDIATKQYNIVKFTDQQKQESFQKEEFNEKIISQQQFYKSQKFLKQGENYDFSKNLVIGDIQPKKVSKGIIELHELFSIFYYSESKRSRFIRLILLFLKLNFMFSIVGYTLKHVSQAENILICASIGLVIRYVYLQFLEILLGAGSKAIQIIAYILIIGSYVGCFFIYYSLAEIQDMTIKSTNDWIFEFCIGYIIDMFVLQYIVSMIKISLYNYCLETKKNQQFAVEKINKNEVTKRFYYQKQKQSDLIKIKIKDYHKIIDDLENLQQKYDLMEEELRIKNYEDAKSACHSRKVTFISDKINSQDQKQVPWFLHRQIYDSEKETQNNLSVSQISINSHNNVNQSLNYPSSQIPLNNHYHNNNNNSETPFNNTNNKQNGASNFNNNFNQQQLKDRENNYEQRRNVYKSTDNSNLQQVNSSKKQDPYAFLSNIPTIDSPNSKSNQKFNNNNDNFEKQQNQNQKFDIHIEDQQLQHNDDNNNFILDSEKINKNIQIQPSFDYQQQQTQNGQYTPENNGRESESQLRSSQTMLSESNLQQTQINNYLIVNKNIAKQAQNSYTSINNTNSQQQQQSNQFQQTSQLDLSSINQTPNNNNLLTQNEQQQQQNTQQQVQNNINNNDLFNKNINNLNEDDLHIQIQEDNQFFQNNNNNKNHNNNHLYEFENHGDDDDDDEDLQHFQINSQNNNPLQQQQLQQNFNNQNNNDDNNNNNNQLQQQQERQGLIKELLFDTSNDNSQQQQQQNQLHQQQQFIEEMENSEPKKQKKYTQDYVKIYDKNSDNYQQYENGSSEEAIASNNIYQNKNSNQLIKINHNVQKQQNKIDTMLRQSSENSSLGSSGNRKKPRIFS